MRRGRDRRGCGFISPGKRRRSWGEDRRVGFVAERVRNRDAIVSAISDGDAFIALWLRRLQAGQTGVGAG